MFVTPVVEHWLKREIAQWVHNEGSPLEQTLYVVQNHTDEEEQARVLSWSITFHYFSRQLV